MKYRIIQRKDEKYEIQRKFLWFWRKYDWWSNLETCREQLKELSAKRQRIAGLPRVIEEFEI